MPIKNGHGRRHLTALKMGKLPTFNVQRSKTLLIFLKRMDSLVVIRVGTDNTNSQAMFSQYKWSSPELPNSQIVREQFMEGKTVYVLFIGGNNIPLYMGKVNNVRPRDAVLDAALPTHDIAGNHLQTIITFTPYDSLQEILNPAMEFFQPVLDYIQFRRGSQVHISDRHISLVLVSFYRGLYQSFLTMNAQINNNYIYNNLINRNVTVINPNYNLNGI
jgi:hypothetical protein